MQVLPIPAQQGPCGREARLQRTRSGVAGADAALSLQRSLSGSARLPMTAISGLRAGAPHVCAAASTRVAEQEPPAGAEQAQHEHAKPALAPAPAPPQPRARRAAPRQAPMLGTAVPVSVLTDAYKASHWLQYPGAQKMVAVSGRSS